MATTITLKSLPDDIYERLKEAAKANYRSINSELIACLEKVLLSAQVSPQQRLNRARQLRKSLKAGNLNLEDIAQEINSLIGFHLKEAMQLCSMMNKWNGSMSQVIDYFNRLIDFQNKNLQLHR